MCVTPVEMNWYAGDLPTWIQAVAALLALIGAIIAAIQAYQALSLQRAADQREVEQLQQHLGRLEQSQAEQVCVWADVVDRNLVKNSIRVYLRNGSTLPVYDVSVGLATDDEVVLDIGVLPPTVAPLERVLPKPVTAGGGPAPWVTFRDSAGAGWLRDGAGRLSRRALGVSPDVDLPEGVGQV